MRVLVVEDDQDIATNLLDYMEAQGWVADLARDGLTGQRMALEEGFDAIVLDLGLPRLDGMELCRRLRDEAQLDTPILILTARDALDEKLDAFDCGADDYLVKPFALKELKARLNALIKRHKGRTTNRRIVVGAIEYDPANVSVSFHGQPVRLSRKCIRLLETMMARPNRVFSRAELEHAAWGDEVPLSDSLRSHMHVLRRALTDTAGRSQIDTVHGVGYRLRIALSDLADERSA